MINFLKMWTEGINGLNDVIFLEVISIVTYFILKGTPPQWNLKISLLSKLQYFYIKRTVPLKLLRQTFIKLVV